MDEEGFQPVRRRGWRRARDAGGRDGEPPASAGGNGSEARDDAGRAQDQEGEPGEEEDNGPPTPRTLHRAWLDEVAVVRRLKGQGLAGDHPAMQAACTVRDEAERSWREAKSPAPAGIRLARAQARLDRALEAQGEAHRALCEYEREHEAKLATLRSRLEGERDKVQARRQQLEAVQEEVGAEGGGARVRARQGAAAKQVHAALCNTVAPTIAALVEQLDSSTPAWGVLNGLLGTLADSSTALERAFVPGPAAQSFDIAGGEADGDSGGEDEGGNAEGSEWSESHELMADGEDPRRGGERAPAPGEGGAHHAWEPALDQWQAQGYGGGGTAQPMETDDWWTPQHEGWHGGSRWQACGHGKWARSSWADAHEQERAEEGADGDPPPAARRRLEPAPAADDGNGGAAPAGDAAEEAQRRRQHEGRVQRIVHAAIDAGIQPITPAGEELQLLDARQLEEWIAVHFPAGAHIQ